MKFVFRSFSEHVRQILHPAFLSQILGVTHSITRKR